MANLTNTNGADSGFFYTNSSLPSSYCVEADITTSNNNTTSYYGGSPWDWMRIDNGTYNFYYQIDKSNNTVNIGILQDSPFGVVGTTQYVSGIPNNNENHHVKVCDLSGTLTEYYDSNLVQTVSGQGNAAGSVVKVATNIESSSFVTVDNLHVYYNAPSVGAITVSPNPVQENTAITASANFTESGEDPHTAVWNWGDGNSTTGTVTESGGSGSVSDSHTYTATGVYTVTLTVTNNAGGATTSTYQYVSVYALTNSFAGGRSFDNPSSAFPITSGKVSFGISSKYSNSNVLTGSVKMNFKPANIDFASTSVQSLTTSNGRAYLKGTGTVNGTGTYTFLATGIDGSVVGGNDLIRLQIKDFLGNVVYDSQPGAGDYVDPATLVATGNIRVH